jgi:aspartyl-tRNA(Asn)/glutamyl-tRNA(Gln) amidotransferase subunit A
MSTSASPRDLTHVAPLIKSGALSPVDLVRTCLDRIAEKATLNAFITVLGDSAIAEARAAEQAIAAGHYRGPLHGIPISVKDLIDVAGVPTTAGSALPARLARADAPIVTRLRSAGAIIIGKTNLHEFAFGTTSDETAFGPVRHPKDPSRSPGGSSGGAAVALVEGMCFGSIGTDTGGSIRIPSAVCGTVGLKPTLGELPCDGIVPLSATLDHVGPMARTVNDVRAMFRAMTGIKNEAAARTPANAKKVFGVPESYFCDRLTPEVRRAFERTRQSLSAAGHDVVVVKIDGASWTPDVYLHICLPEASWYHAPTLESHPQGYSPGVRLRLEMGRYILAEDMARAFRLREVLTDAVDAALQRCDALLLPTQPIPAPSIGAAMVDVDGQSMPTRAAMLRLTQLFNVTGHPAIAIPAGATTDGWPVSVQLVGVRGDTEGLLTTASAVESQITGGPGSVGGGTG